MLNFVNSNNYNLYQYHFNNHLNNKLQFLNQYYQNYFNNHINKFVNIKNISSSTSSFSNKNNDLHRTIQKQRFLEAYLKNNGDAASTIIPNFLFLGGHHSINNIDALTKQNIKYVLNMAAELNLNELDYSSKNIKLLQIPARDHKSYNIRADFLKAFKFIDECLKNKQKIIINCARGISRSATIVIAYLMFRYNLRLDNAYKTVLNLRPQIRPNEGFRRTLELYQLELDYSRKTAYRRNN